MTPSESESPAPAVATALSRALSGRRDVLVAILFGSDLVAHGYSGVDVEHVHAGATGGLGGIEAFAVQVSAWTARRPASD